MDMVHRGGSIYDEMRKEGFAISHLRTCLLSMRMLFLDGVRGSIHTHVGPSAPDLALCTLDSVR